MNIRSIRGRRTLQSLWRFPDVQSCGLTVCWRPASGSGVQGEQRVVAVFIRPGAFQSHTIAIIINSLCRVQSQAPRSTPPLFSPSVPPALLTFFFLHAPLLAYLPWSSLDESPLFSPWVANMSLDFWGDRSNCFLLSALTTPFAATPTSGQPSSLSTTCVRASSARARQVKCVIRAQMAATFECSNNLTANRIRGSGIHVGCIHDHRWSDPVFFFSRHTNAPSLSKKVRGHFQSVVTLERNFSPFI